MFLALLPVPFVGTVPASAQGPEPSTRFSDAAEHTAVEDIVVLDGLGVLERTECSPPGESAAARFCPSEPLSRWAMAVWLVRALDGEEPPRVESTRFADVRGSAWWAGHVERLAELEITRGYDDGTFRPDRTVTRAQMASFLARAFELPAAEDAGFSDITDNTHASAINSVAESGITRGCGDGSMFCPGRETTRGEMAAFIARALRHAFPSRIGAEHRSLTAVSAGLSHACGLRQDASIVCWGNNTIIPA